MRELCAGIYFASRQPCNMTLGPSVLWASHVNLVLLLDLSVCFSFIGQKAYEVQSGL